MNLELYLEGLPNYSLVHIGKLVADRILTHPIELCRLAPVYLAACQEASYRFYRASDGTIKPNPMGASGMESSTKGEVMSDARVRRHPTERSVVEAEIGWPATQLDRNEFDRDVREQVLKRRHELMEFAHFVGICRPDLEDLIDDFLRTQDSFYTHWIDP